MVESCDLGEKSGVSTEEGDMGNAGDGERGVDMIRELPVDIIVKILSSLPTKDAVRTLMIPSFANLWTCVYNLDFDWCQFHDCSNCRIVPFPDYESGLPEFRRFVRSVLANHRGDKIHKFRINFESEAVCYSLYNEYDEMKMEHIRLSGEIDSWIEFAVNKGVEILEIDLMSCMQHVNYYRHNLPSSVLQCGSLTSLKLVTCNVGASEISMPMLRSLFLEDVKLNDEIIRKFLASCPLLESLAIMKCVGLGELHCDSRQLSTLRIGHNIIEQSKLRVICPYVTSLTISGGIERMKLKEVSGLQDVSIDCSDLSSLVPNDYLKVRKIFKSFCHARCVTMGPQLVRVFTVSELLDMSSPSNSWQHLVIQTTLTKWRLPGIRNLLRSCLCLETLCLHIVLGEYLSPAWKAWMQQYEFDENNCWDSPDQSFRLLHRGESLESITVTMTVDVTNCQVLPLLQLLLGKARVLEQLVIRAFLYDDSASVEKWEDFVKKLSTLPRASPRLTVSLSVAPPITRAESRKFKEYSPPQKKRVKAKISGV